MYEEGLGVDQDYLEAAKWYKKAAEQGLADAQYNLASLYHDGRGVTPDFILAHMWYNLAAAQGNPNASQNRNDLATIMTPAQVAEAQRLAREWKSKRKTK